MKHSSSLLGFFIFAFILALSSCIVVDNNEISYGPDGRDGKAFFGIDYDVYSPYSYWDNNPSLPSNPFFGEYYRSYPGIFEFEYFVNANEYWYGTYELNINRGEPGRPNGISGRDGQDTYLLLICNPNGFYFEQSHFSSMTQLIGEDGTVSIEAEDKHSQFRVVMKKTTIQERPTFHFSKK